MAFDAFRLSRVLIALAVLVMAALTTGPALAAEGPLAKADAARYREAFGAADRGDFDEADAILATVKDRSLVGHVAFVKLMHPTAYRATYAELADWLKGNSELGGAERIYALAQKRQPAKAPEPKAPSFLAVTRDWASVDQTAILSGDRSFAARDAYYSGQTARAWALAPAAGEPWIAALAGWRLGKLEEARGYFLSVAEDDGNDDWLRSAAWFWAGRCSERLSEEAVARGYFARAAATPYTFYGVIAVRRLEMVGAPPVPFRTSAATAAEPEEPRSLLVRVSTKAERRYEGLLDEDPRARRAAALAQIDRPIEAAQELRVGLALAKTESAQKQWQALIQALNIPLQVAAVGPAPTKLPSRVPAAAKRKPRPYRAEPYEVPELYPDGGFTLDRALIYALVRQESRFNPYAYSPAGAIGLMQVRPDAAARAAGDDNLLNNVMPLFDPPVNLRVGQDYMTWLMERGLGGGDEAYDLFRVIAAYNGGAGAVLKTRGRLEPDADALLFMESLPAQETREYVEKVAFNYWTYRRMFGQTTPTLDAAAKYSRLVDMRIDR
jgi:soluble lytic murein transglycosylase-like protein